MALTTEEEKILREQLIPAAIAAKRISELPTGSGNIFNYMVAALNALDGETYQVALTNFFPYLEEQVAYGIEWDTTVSSSACTRIGGNLALHRSLPLQNRMKGCLLADDGKVNEYMNPKDWTAHDRSGARGQVEVEVPDHYRKFETDGTKQRAKISEFPIPGYHLVSKHYTGSYEASWDRETGMLCSVANMSPRFRGGNNQSEWDGTNRSLLGRPVTSKSRPQFRTAARARGAGTQWNQLVYGAHKAYSWLYFIEYANLNCQLPFNAQKDANGYAQGGLGNGVTTLTATEWGDFNEANPFIPCGHTDALGNGSGEVPYDILNEDGTVLKTVVVSRYRGIENPFGHTRKWTDGINIEVKTDADGGTSKVYVCDDPAMFSDTSYDGYQVRGLAARTEGYIKEMIIGEFGEIIPVVVGGSSTTYWCDRYRTDTSASSLRSVMFGGYATIDTYAGLGWSDISLAPLSTSTLTGTRLCFIPNVNQ
jgi:hypothetical protein